MDSLLSGLCCSPIDSGRRRYGSVVDALGVDFGALGVDLDALGVDVGARDKSEREREREQEIGSVINYFVWSESERERDASIIN